MSEASSALARLNALVGVVVDLRNAASLIGGDERVSMPPGGVAVHGDMAATIQRIAHEVTYKLHVMVRVEIEIAMLTGAISTDSVSTEPYLEYLESKWGELYGVSSAVRT